MNKELLLRVADAVEGGEVRGDPVELNMCAWHSHQTWSCGTTACIGGYVDLLIDESHRAIDIDHWLYKQERVGIFTVAREALDLSTKEAHLLMTDTDAWGDIHRSKGMVPDALRWMALTGRIDWDEALSAARCVDEQKPWI